MGDDSGANMHVGAQATDMVMVLMGVDQESNRFVRDQFYDFIEDCKIALLIQRRFHHRNIVFEFHDDAIVRGAAE